MKYKDIVLLSKKDDEFQAIIKDIIKNSEVQRMKQFRVHGQTNCYTHCYLVSYLSYLACKKHHLDYISAARAGMLHDFYLYDWRVKNSHKGLHGFTHPLVAYENSKKYFQINSTEKDIILTHMWPLTFLTVPCYKESWIVTLIDKRCAFHELISSIISSL